MHVWTWSYQTNDTLVDALKSSDLASYPSILIQIFSGNLDRSLLQNIASTLHSEVPSAVIIGATTAGEIENATMHEESIIISVTAFDHTALKSIHINDIDSNSLGRYIAQNIITEETKSIIMFADGIKCNGDEILSGFNDVAKNDIIIAGGMAGDNYRFQQTYLIHGADVFDAGVVAVALNGPELSVFHNYNLSWRPIGREMLITKAQGNRIYEIDHKPILEIYRTYLGKEVVIGMPDSAIEFPLLFIQGGVTIARSMIAVMEDGSILYAGEIPLNEKVRFGIGNSSLFNEGIDKSYGLSAQNPIEALFIYSCAGRKAFLGKALENEFEPLANIAPLSGFFTYGEFYHSHEGNKLLNITTTMLGLSESSAPNPLIKPHSIGKKDRKDLAFSALTNLIDVSTRELEQEFKKHLQTNTFLNQYINAIEKAFIFSKSDPRGIITEVNDNFCSISGYSRNELIGKSHNIVRHPDMPKEIFKELWDDISNGKTWQGVIKNRKKYGGNYYVKTTIFPMINEKGNIIEYIGLREDITPIEIAKQKAQEADEIKTSFMANMSHEIRTPINGIAGFVDLLTKTSLNTKQEKYLSIINDSIHALTHIVNNLLDFSNIDSGKIKIKPVKINLYNELHDIKQLFLPKAIEKEIDYNLSLDNNLNKCLKIDLQHLKQILNEIIRNAIKFTPNGGQILVSVDVLNDTATQQVIKFSIADTGIGIREENLNIIFDKFSQVDISDTRKFGGTGIGLPIANALVTLMGGVLHVESKENEGSLFSFQITVEKCLSNATISNPYDEAVTYAANLLNLDDTIIKRLFNKFLISVFEDIEKLNLAINNKVYEDINQYAQKIEGASGTLGLTTIQRKMKEIKDHALNKNADYDYADSAAIVLSTLETLKEKQVVSDKD